MEILDVVLVPLLRGPFVLIRLEDKTGLHARNTLRSEATTLASIGPYRFEENNGA